MKHRVGDGWRGSKLKTSFVWGTTWICTRAYLVNDLEEEQNIEMCG